MSNHLENMQPAPDASAKLPPEDSLGDYRSANLPSNYDSSRTGHYQQAPYSSYEQTYYSAAKVEPETNQPNPTELDLNRKIYPHEEPKLPPKFTDPASQAFSDALRERLNLDDVPRPQPGYMKY